MRFVLIRSALVPLVLSSALWASIGSAQALLPKAARIVVFAHSDSASVALAQALHRQLEHEPGVELLGEVVTQDAPLADSAARAWTIEQKRDQAIVLKADAFVDVKAERMADVSRATVALGYTDPFVVDVINEVKQGTLDDVAVSVVKRFGTRWQSGKP